MGSLILFLIRSDKSAKTVSKAQALISHGLTTYSHLTRFKLLIVIISKTFRSFVHKFSMFKHRPIWRPPGLFGVALRAQRANGGLKDNRENNYRLPHAFELVPSSGRTHTQRGKPNKGEGAVKRIIEPAKSTLRSA
jgi:hypothetical protein